MVAKRIIQLIDGRATPYEFFDVFFRRVPENGIGEDSVQSFREIGAPVWSS
jgi:hypothetical protein